MMSIIVAIALIVLLCAIYFIIDLNKIKNFDKYINLDVEVDFSEGENVKRKGKYGLILFKIKAIKNESRAFCIEKVKINNKNIQIRTHNNIYAKLPLPSEGVTLSVGVRKIRKINGKELSKCKITISGFLMLDQNKKIHFKKALSLSNDKAFVYFD